MARPAVSVVANPSADPGESNRRSIRVLLVEERPGSAGLVQVMLGEAWPSRFLVHCAGSFGDAPAHARAHDFDVVLLDVECPDARAVGALEALHRALPALPIVVLCTSDDDERILAMVRAGAQDCLVKGQGNGAQLERAIRHAVQRRTVEARLERLAQFDALTGLANRGLFEERLARTLARAKRAGTRPAVLYVDIDGFKQINDRFGHASGDDVLRSAARRMSNCVRETDTVARLGGDEFTLVLENVKNAQGAARVAQKIVTALAEPFRVAGHAVPVSASVGIAVYPDRGADARTLSRDADAAMYRSKRDGGNTFRFANEMLDARAEARLARERRLARALDNDEFQLFYQPQVALDTGRVVGMEALLRWIPEGADALLRPGDFIPLAEETGLILPLGEWVLHSACLQSRAWREAGLCGSRVSVNLSARQLERADLPDTIDAVLADTGVDPGALELELAESDLIASPEAGAAQMEAIKARGVRISVDDFGTGYSSLAYLRGLPVDRLKIDQSFVRNLDDGVNHALATAIVNLAHTLGLDVVAEGVETVGQLRSLRLLEPDAVQGFLIARPRPVAALGDLTRHVRLPGAPAA